MKTARTSPTASAFAPKRSARWRDQRTSYARPAAPETKKHAARRSVIECVSKENDYEGSTRRRSSCSSLRRPVGHAALERVPDRRISLPQNVKLGDGSVLQAGKYDVQIDYKGFGNAAELRFFQGGVFKGKTTAEARGFPSAAPAGVSGDGNLAHKAADPNLETIKQGLKVDANEKWAPASDSDGYKEHRKRTTRSRKRTAPGAVQSFSWGAHGFAAGNVGKASISGNGVKVTFDSSNSAAGFSAILPVMKK